MNLRQAIKTTAALTLAVAALSISVAYGQGAAVRPRRIAVLGSSVANGTGDELAKEG
jgi:hypothetical protein